MNKLGIVTPHYNNFNGLLSIYRSLASQTSQDWEWIIVDDKSDETNNNKISNFFKDKRKVKILFNESNVGPSISRNRGAKLIKSDKIVFLDSDDLITSNFVKNRLVFVEDFVVFSNMTITDKEESYSRRFSDIKSDFLNAFLKAKFPWQTTAVLWNKSFFEKLHGFDTSLKLLEDIELSMRALIESSDYKILIENEIDFFYVAKRIDSKSRPFFLVVESVEKLISKIKNNISLNDINFFSNYYFLSVRYFLRDKNADFKRLNRHLSFMKSQNVINNELFFMGKVVLILYPILGNDLFLKINRKIFKKI